MRAFTTKGRLMLPFVVSGVYVVGGGLTAGSMMALLSFCRLLVGQLVL